jgi:plastocyanin
MIKNMPRVVRFIVFVLLLSAAPSRSETAWTVNGQVLINAAPASGAVVFLETQDGRPIPSRPTVFTVIQKDKRFSPVFGVVPVGSTIRFENHDNEIHNIHSKAPTNRFDTGGHLPGTVKEVTLKNPGAVPLRCRTHADMRGLLYVAPSPFFGATDHGGRFEIGEVPTGTYRIRSWHTRLTSEEQAQGTAVVRVGGGAPAAVEIRLTAKAPAGADLTGTLDRDWAAVVREIREGLDRAVALWKKGSFTPATAKVMSTQSGLYGETGLKGAITEHLGKDRAEEHDRRMDGLRKRIQGIGEAPVTESELRRLVSEIIEGLMQDLQQIGRQA